MKHALLTLALAALLAACGGGGDECRVDFVGPPSPGFEDLPLCPDEGRSRIPLPNCTTHPEACQ
jgi:hypothetical protein